MTATSLDNSAHWHTLSEDELFAKFKTTRDGLSAAEVTQRLAEHGANGSGG